MYVIYWRYTIFSSYLWLYKAESTLRKDLNEDMPSLIQATALNLRKAILTV